MLSRMAIAAAGAAVALLTGGGTWGTAGPARPQAAPAASRDASAAVRPAAAPGTAGSAEALSASPAAKPLAGKVVGIDPGHNGRNRDDPTYINHRIWNGREWEACDTTGTETDGGYTEARYNFNVARYLRADLRAAGARVVMTRYGNNGVGPCVNRRAWILNDAHANVSIDIHADGGPAWGRGFTVLEPVADGPNDKVIRKSEQFGSDVRAAILAHTPMPESDYYGSHGIIFRDDLAGLNLTTEPKVLIETGNMRNAADARLLVTTSFQEQMARALADAIIRYLTGRG
ncbi:MAG: N-acetylmuramoyl-L-alanine amidase [Streptosporangiaceae bacterium]|jgi:N-acetylmuramoyl-L-alanine amidase